MDAYSKEIVQIGHVAGKKNLIYASQLMKARDLAEACREYKLMHRVLMYCGK